MEKRATRTYIVGLYVNYVFFHLWYPRDHFNSGRQSEFETFKLSSFFHRLYFFLKMAKGKGLNSVASLTNKKSFCKLAHLKQKKQYEESMILSIILARVKIRVKIRKEYYELR